MKFTMMRDRVVASTFGHAVGFKKGVATHVPPSMYEEVQAAGAIPEDELPEPTSKSPELTSEDRKLLLQAALEDIVKRNDSKDFTAGGMPHVKVVSEKAGFSVDADERDAAWAAFNAAK
ncbi:MAG: hypothetical protein REI11_19665 [Patulibacter sp.]|nr:hypothetical protein [Patulibacter sp.]